MKSKKQVKENRSYLHLPYFKGINQYKMAILHIGLSACIFLQKLLMTSSFIKP